MRQENMRRLISIASLLILFGIFSVTSNGFLTLNNIISILRESSVIGIIAVGVACVIITAGIDLSTGAIVGFTGMVSAYLLYYYEVPGPIVMLVSILVGILCGCLNGFIVTVLRVPAFIATLSTQYLFRSMVFVFAIRQGGVITNKLIKDRNILILGGSINGIYLVTIVFVLFVVIGQFLLKKTQLGVHIYATGSHEKSAELSGIPTTKIRFITFVMSGFLCGLASLFQIGRIGSVTTDLGTGMEFDVIASVVIGGCAFSGGRGDVVGASIGALFMAVLQNGILKYNLPTASQLIIKGVVIVIMVVFDAAYNQFIQTRIQRKAREADEAELAGGES